MARLGFTSRVLRAGRTASAFLIVAAVVCADSASAALSVSKQGGEFIIVSPVYRASVSAETGFLTRMSVNDADLIKDMKLDTNSLGPIIRRDVSQEGPTTVVAYLTVKRGDNVLERVLRIGYEAQDDSLQVKILASEGGGAGVVGRGPSFAVGETVQMVRSLDFKETVPMPAVQSRTPWQRVKFYYANGATLGLLNEGAGNPINPNENGGVWECNYGRGGYVANSEYVYSLIVQTGDGPALGAPPMRIAETQTPAVYWQGDPVTAHLEIAAAQYRKLAGLRGLAIKYEVQDVFGSVAATGAVPLDISSGADPLSIAVTLPVHKLGWYRAYFTVNDEGGSLLEGKERLIFSVLKRQENMGERFDNQVQTDYTIGLGFMRNSLDPTRIDDIERMVDERVKQARGTDVFVSYQIDGSPVGNDAKRFGEVCFNLFDRVNDRIPRIEIINEPNGNFQPKEYVETFLRPAYENIKRASPNTQVLGPVLCGIGPDQARYLSELYELGLKDLTDELTFHPYAGNFDDGNGVTAMQRILEVIAANGDSDKPIHFTEAGYGHNGWSGIPALREIVKHAVSQYVWQNAVMGIDHRHNFYYFTDIMGYYDMWLRATQLTPAAVALRTYVGFVKGQQRARRLDFGSLDVVRAFLYDGADRKVIVLWTASNWVPDGADDPATEVVFEVNTREVEYFDCFGNPLPMDTRRRRRLKLSVGSYPSYLVCSPRTRLEPIPEDWGTNMAVGSLGATAESSSEQGTAPAVLAIDGNNGSYTAWQSLTPNELPQSLTISLAGLSTIDRVGIWGYSPRGYELEAMGADGEWATLVSRRDQPYRRFRSETFKPIVTDQVRLTVVDSHTPRVEIAEMEIYSPGGEAGRGMELVNWALKSNGSSATASSAMVKEVSVAEMVWGSDTPRINKIGLKGVAENAIDGKRLIGDWREFFPTTWVAASGEPLPQWLQIDFGKARTISAVTVYTVAFKTWTPADSGIKAWDVQVWDGAGWKTVSRVEDNERVSKVSRISPAATTDKIRIVVRGTNDSEGTIGIMEVEAFGPR